MATIQLRLTPIAGASQAVTGNNFAVAFNENNPGGVRIAKITGFAAADAGRIQEFTFAPNTAAGSAGNDGGRYRIVLFEGEWYVETVDAGNRGPDFNFNFETRNGFRNQINFTVSPPNGTTDTYVNAQFTFNLLDVAEAPESTAIAWAAGNEILETTQDGTVVATLTATDDDEVRAEGHNDNLVYRIVDQNGVEVTNGPFRINKIPGSDTQDAVFQVVVRDNAQLNVTADELRQLRIQVEDPQGNKSIISSFDYIAKNVGSTNTPPTNIRLASGGTVDEAAGTGAAVGTVTADDNGPASELRYSMAANANFEINATTGAITIKNGANLNYEAGSVYTVAVTVRDTNGTGQAATRDITINLRDVNEAPTDITYTNAATNLQAGVTMQNAQVVLATAVDPDTLNAAFRNNDYRFANNTQTDGAYTIDAQTGQITTNRALTAADAGPKTLTVVAYDATNGALTYTEDYTFTVAPANIPTIAISASNAVQNEGNTGTTEFTFTVTRSSGVGTSSVNWTVEGSGANPASAGDFANLSGVVEFEAGQTSKTITVRVVGDLDIEANENFIVKLSGAVNGTITTDTANGVINNDDAPTGTPVVSIVADSANKHEGTGDGSAKTAYTFTVTRTNGVGVSTVDWTVVGTGNSPASSNDFADITDSVVFADGEISKTITIEVLADTFIENDETFSVILSNPQNATIANGAGTANGVIRNDDVNTPVNQRPLDLTLSSYSIRELSDANVVVGTFAVNDPDSASWSYSLIGDGAGGRFKVDAFGRLVVDNGFKLDFEQATSHNVTVRVTDDSGNVFDKTLTISVTDWGAESTLGSLMDDVFKGGAGVDNLSGNAGNDKLYGADGKDLLNGGIGNDTVWGGYGNDTIWGGIGKDIFVFDGKLGTSKTDRKVNFDTIKDYSVKDDSIWLDNDLFKSNKALYNAIKKGTESKPLKMASKFFTVGDKAKQADDYFVYDAKKRVLYYDADGSGSKAAIELATFTNNKALKNFKATELFFI